MLNTQCGYGVNKASMPVNKFARLLPTVSAFFLSDLVFFQPSSLFIIGTFDPLCPVKCGKILFNLFIWPFFTNLPHQTGFNEIQADIYGRMCGRNHRMVLWTYTSCWRFSCRSSRHAGQCYCYFFSLMNGPFLLHLLHRSIM